jgi:hypothetical protein
MFHFDCALSLNKLYDTVVALRSTFLITLVNPISLITLVNPINLWLTVSNVMCR